MWAPMLDAGLWNQTIRRLYGEPRGGTLAVVNGVEVSQKVFEQVVLKDPFTCSLQYEGPVFIGHSRKDERLPVAVSEDMIRRRKEKNLHVTVCLTESSGHIFEIAVEGEALLAQSVEFFVNLSR